MGNRTKSTRKPQEQRRRGLLRKAKRLAEPRLSVTDHLIQYARPIFAAVWARAANVPIVLWIPLALLLYIGLTDVLAKRRESGTDGPQISRMPVSALAFFVVLALGLIVYQAYTGDEQMPLKKLVAAIFLSIALAASLICLAVYRYLSEAAPIEAGTDTPAVAQVDAPDSFRALLRKAEAELATEKTAHKEAKGKVWELQSKVRELERSLLITQGNEGGRLKQAEERHKMELADVTAERDALKRRVNEFEEKASHEYLLKVTRANFDNKVENAKQQDPDVQIEDWLVAAAVALLEEHRRATVESEEQLQQLRKSVDADCLVINEKVYRTLFPGGSYGIGGTVPHTVEMKHFNNVFSPAHNEELNRIAYFIDQIKRAEAAYNAGKSRPD